MFADSIQLIIGDRPQPMAMMGRMMRLSIFLLVFLVLSREWGNGMILHSCYGF
jgi:hypothetical protein